jgi:hypothetical protein
MGQDKSARGSQDPVEPGALEGRPSDDPALVAARLRWAGSRGVEALRAEGRARREKERIRILLPAAQEIHDALADLVKNRTVWNSLTEAESAIAALDRRQIVALQHVYDQDLAGLLAYLGYQEPPPRKRMVGDLLRTLDELLANLPGTGGNGITVEQARENLSVFVGHLRVLIEGVEQGERGPSRRRRVVLRRTLRRAVRVGVSVTVPAGLAAAAAGGFGVVFSSPAVGTAAVGLVGAAALIEGGKEAIKSVVQLGFSRMLGRVLAPERATAPPEAVLRGAAARASVALSDLDVALADLTDSGRRRIEIACIAAVGACYGVLYAATLIPGPADAVNETAERCVTAIKRIQGVIGPPVQPADVDQIQRELRTYASKLTILADTNVQFGASNFCAGSRPAPPDRLDSQAVSHA